MYEASVTPLNQSCGVPEISLRNLNTSVTALVGTAKAAADEDFLITAVAITVNSLKSSRTKAVENIACRYGSKSEGPTEKLTLRSA